MSTRGSPRTYEPRVIRVDTARSVDNACVSSSSTSPTRTRRPSATGVRAPSVQRPPVGHPPSLPPITPTTFPRPAYLDRSALRHLLQTEPPRLPGRTEPVTIRVGSPGHSAGRSRRRSPSSDSDEEDVSPPRELPPTTPSVLLSSSPILRLPTRWSDAYRNDMLSLSYDGRELIYHGVSSSADKDAAAARTIYPIPPACGIYYYEVEITSKGNKGNISIGFMGRDVKVSRLPGWEKNSWGYHGDDGSSFAAEGRGTPYGPEFGAGDVIGCGIDFCQNRAFYTKNGTLIGPVFENVGRDCDLYPAVGLCHSGESIRANFGHEPFKYAIEDHTRRQQNLAWDKIQSKPLEWPPISGMKYENGAEGSKDAPSGSSLTAEERVKVPINQLVLSYLAHHGYARSARAFEAQCKSRGGLSHVDSLTRIPPPISSASRSIHDHGMDMDDVTSGEAQEGDIELRTRIVGSVTTGDIDTALIETQTHFPSVLEREEGLMLFKLRCRKFVELVLEAAELKKKMKMEESEMTMETEYENSDVFKREWADGMDVDDGASPSLYAGSMVSNGHGASSAAIPIKAKRKQSFASSQHSWGAATALQYGSALEKAVQYGQILQSDYKDRPEIRAIFKRTSVIMAYDDPLEAGGDAAEVAGQGARVALATELNQAILRSQGHPTHPALEKLYRQTAACVIHLALLGVGTAAFADMPREFLDA
ncbi:hypothetical protein SERLA73DRAFT_116956 [Serpula lacrymans var. lacrymans S7.3]|uniref:B30.2/SPRY domain-containing protein n=2 Tax=Serpula lacrymans var. lacrymans TaxID=341189 RepID=F8QG57_SERL3|nr:uncharacterized protein SERLADRAFT_442942 [Serpula lacrymans var. lacrymans S7.9]EGN92672.1 hypothetical protein SERLA73DRAFT_116956 [Serpula lacrymans var. lacrymans S7.3]EGO19466.1 hypothetical protein SERLADRAFT_442942 [Serpula lacrymans var. lacrymans S7.9]